MSQSSPTGGNLPAPGSPDYEIISLGMHASELATNLQSASPDNTFTPLLADAGLLPEELRGARVIPAVTYGIEGTRPAIGAVELLPGTSALMQENLGTSHFNPHLSVRTRAHVLLDRLVGKGKKRVRGETFGLPSYVFFDGRDRSLFIGGTDHDLEVVSAPYAERLATAYELGHIVLGSEVVVGTITNKLGHVSLPTVVREIGTTISDFDVSYAQRVNILKEAHKNWTEGKSPDYRPYLKSRKHRFPGS